MHASCGHFMVERVRKFFGIHRKRKAVAKAYNDCSRSKPAK
jgi:hypothetical protein